MRIVGKWEAGDDIPSAVIEIEVRAADGHMELEPFLIDCGADRTVFSTGLLRKLGFPGKPAPPGLTLEGIGGGTEFVLVSTVVRFARDDGGVATVRGEFAAFTDASATDLSILGRDVLNIFDLILSHRRDEVSLLRDDHSYRVVTV